MIRRPDTERERAEETLVRLLVAGGLTQQVRERPIDLSLLPRHLQFLCCCPEPTGPRGEAGDVPVTLPWRVRKRKNHRRHFAGHGRYTVLHWQACSCEGLNGLHEAPAACISKGKKHPGATTVVARRPYVRRVWC